MHLFKYRSIEAIEEVTRQQCYISLCQKTDVYKHVTFKFLWFLCGKWWSQTGCVQGDRKNCFWNNIKSRLKTKLKTYGWVILNTPIRLCWLMLASHRLKQKCCCLLSTESTSVQTSEKSRTTVNISLRTSNKSLWSGVKVMH